MESTQTVLAPIREIHKKLVSESDSHIPSVPLNARFAMRNLNADWNYGSPLITSAAEIRSIWFYHAGDILDLLMVGESFQATDARDKVYSILGLGRVSIALEGSQLDLTNTTTSSGAVPLPSMVIDYNKPTSEVYQDMAKYLINRDQNFDILCVACLFRNSHFSDLPTWCPDWRVEESTNVEARKDFFELKYAAAGSSNATFQRPEELGVLHAQAYIVDLVIEVLDVTCTAVELLNGMLDEVRGRPVNLPLRPFDASLDFSRCCKTIGDRMCLVPAASEPGDRIFVLLGSKVPFVMREVNGQKIYLSDDGSPDFNNLKWHILGPVCIPDLMYGGLMRRIRDETTDVDLLNVSIL